jgi:hypothetical protein
MKKIQILILCGIVMTQTACYKVEHTRENKYDDGYAGKREYSLEFDHIAVVNETSTVNVNGLLDVDEKAQLNVYLKNNGPDPCLLSYGTFKTVNTVSGFYIQNADIGINDGGLHFIGSTEAAGYKVQYIDPGAVDCIRVDVRVYPYCNPNQNVACTFKLMDYDGTEHTVNFSVHVE